MDPVWHPPLALGTIGPGTDHLHARLWLRAAISEWDTLREAHFHLVRPLDPGAGTSFRIVDMSRLPLRRAPDRQEPDGLRQWAVRWLEEWLDGWSLTVWRCPQLGIVSELDETEGEFRRRVLRWVQPEIEHRIETDRARPLPWIPWRRRRAKAERRRRREEIAARLGELVAAIEGWQPRRVAGLVQHVELGLLSIPPGTHLPRSGRHHDPHGGLSPDIQHARGQ